MIRSMYLTIVLLFACTSLLRGGIIWNDGFESGNFNAWSAANGAWSIVTSSTAAHSGTKGADVKGASAPDSGDTLFVSVPTLNYQNIELGYWYKVRDTLEPADSVFVEWTTDETNWQTLAHYTNVAIGSWQYEHFSLPAEADDATDFCLRIRANLSGTTDRMSFDDFTIDAQTVPDPGIGVAGIGIACLLLARRKK